MYSKFFQHSDAGILEAELDMFLKELEEVTGQVVDVKILQRDNEILVVVIYSCWKKL